MNIRYLTIFTTVCKYMNMTKASKELYISQPSISQAIKEIEILYNAQLFERSKRRLRLTAGGEILLAYCHNLLDMYSKLEQEMRLEGGAKLNLGATITIGTYLLADILKKIPQDISVNSLVENTESLEKRLLNFDVDIVLSEGIFHSNDVVAKPFKQDKLVFICSTIHRFVGMKEVNAFELSAERLFIREKGSGSRSLLLDVLEDVGVDISIAGEFNSNEAIKNCVRAGLGVGVVSETALGLYDQNYIKVVEIEGVELIRDFSLCYHKDKYLNDHLQKVIDLLVGKELP